MAKQASAQVSNPGLIDRMLTFRNEVMDEMRKVSWPKMEETKAHTYIVIFLLVVIGLIIGAYDYIFKTAVLLLLRFT